MEQQLIDLYWNIRASKLLYYDMLLTLLQTNFKYCRMQIENVSHWFTVKNSISNHVSLCQGIRFLLAFPQRLVNLGYSIEFRLRFWKQ